MQSPVCVARNILAEEDAVKPDYVAIGEYEDLYRPDNWIPTDYQHNPYPDPIHTVNDLYWTLCWDQKPLVPGGASRTIVTYYGVGSATTKWTYMSGKTPVRDSVALAVQAPLSLKYDSTVLSTNNSEASPSPFPVDAYIYNLDTDPGQYDLKDVTAFIYLPPGLKLAATEPSARKQVGAVPINSEYGPIEWMVEATGDYCGELPIYVSATDQDSSGIHWQQTVVRKIIVPACKQGQFQFGWQLMHVPFSFNNPIIEHAFNLTPGTFGARYYDSTTQNYKPVVQVQPGQAFWMYTGGLSWGQTSSFGLAPDAAIVGELGGTQAKEQHITLTPGWNLIGNPLVYPIYWGQVLVYYQTPNDTVTLDTAVNNRWISKTLFGWNSDKYDYDVLSDKSTLLNPWKGYWVQAYKPVTLVFRPPLFPSCGVTSAVGGL